MDDVDNILLFLKCIFYILKGCLVVVLEYIIMLKYFIMPVILGSFRFLYDKVSQQKRTFI